MTAARRAEGTEPAADLSSGQAQTSDKPMEGSSSNIKGKRNSKTKGKGKGDGTTVVRQAGPAGKGTTAAAPAPGKTKTTSKKGSGVDGSAPPPVANRELLLRMNFLHQASLLVANAIAGPSPDTSRTTKGKVKRERPLRSDGGSSSRKAGLHNQDGDLIDTQPADGDTEASHGAPPQDVEMRSFTEPGPYAAASESLSTSPPSPSGKRKRTTPLSIGKPLLDGPWPARDASRSGDLYNEKRKQQLLEQHQRMEEQRGLSSIFVADIRAVARKSVLRLDPNVKRQLCRVCDTVLIPGITSSVRIKTSGPHVHVQRTRCMTCGTSRVIPCPPLLAGVNTEETPPREASAGHSRTRKRKRKGPAAKPQDRQLGLQEEESRMDGPPPGGAVASAPTHGEQNTGTDACTTPATVTSKEQGSSVMGGTALPPASKVSTVAAARTTTNVASKGTGRQHRKQRFHERPEHAIWVGTTKLGQ